MLLRLDDEGELLPEHKPRMSYVLVAAALMDLAFMGRIDTDAKRFMIMDLKLTHNSMFDRMLLRLGNLGLLEKDTAFVVESLLDEADGILEWALDSLVERGILERQEARFLWMRTTRHPVNDERPERRAKLRLMDVLFSEAPPDPRDIALICLADSWGIIGRVLSQEELDRAMPRIRLLRKMDLIGAAMRRLIEEFDEVFMTLAMRVPLH